MRFVVRVGAMLAVVAALVFGWNYVTLQRPLEGVLAGDRRNAGIAVRGHYEHWVNPAVLVFDLREVAGTSAPMDVDRVLLQFADALQRREFRQVVLAHRGHPKFLLPGDHFRTLGVEYGTQNPVYTLRTLPEQLARPDGTPAFGTWTGGLLGVTLRQMEDLSDFHEQWFLQDLVARAR